MRNPKWKRDELILALELYFRLDYGQMSSGNKEVVELSAILNKLPIHDLIPNAETFRNANGVAIKLNNFKAIDPDYTGEGMKSHSKLDEEVFMEFYQNREKLWSLSKQIKAAVINEDLRVKLSSIEDDDVSVKEGKVLYKLHKCRERDSSINTKKKTKCLKETGKLECEVCGFDFYETYGELGKGFIECHHKEPLSSLDSETVTKVNDLALICSNCHRMIHRLSNVMSIEELRKEIKR